MARKILLADDSVTAQNMGRKILADAGYEVITVNNGSAALKKINEQKPDLIVLDVYMPGYSGLEVCQRLKDAHDTARIPVLLTVGKLEPFKPEEAKRVRAEGFIVKPFEASELLSALTKLEDKIVPRGESSKQGRFARAIASVEDAGREGGEEDSGWKNRISFPSKKKAKNKDEEEQERAEETALYNQVNRDLRTVPQDEIEQKPGAASSHNVADLSALAAQLPKDGLPKDVTLEEIAAIAAAAAQVQAASSEAVAQRIEDAPFPAIQKAEEKVEAPVSSVETKPAVEIAAQEEAPASATFADVREANQREEKIEAGEPAKQEEQKPVEVAAPVSAADIGNEAIRTTEQPTAIAIAAAASASVGLSGSRWMAVPVTTDAAEAATSLDQEMQKAYAEFVAGEAKAAAAHVPEASAIASSVIPEVAAPAPAPIATAPSEVTTPVPAAIAEPSPRATTHEESELGQALSAVANAPAETPQLSAPEPASVAQAIPALPESSPEAISSAAQAEVAPRFQAEANIPEPSPMSEVTAEPMAQKEEPAVSANEVAANVENAVTDAPAQPVAAVPAATNEPARRESFAGGIPGMADHRDSDLADSTAAAWASWRQIRSDEPRAAEPSKSRKQVDDDDESAPSRAQSAMAVAAGAEKRPEGAASVSDPRAIASIVDSVLAELRPKIVEEISKKLGEK